MKNLSEKGDKENKLDNYTYLNIFKLLQFITFIYFYIFLISYK